jgi:hypothetical protein
VIVRLQSHSYLLLKIEYSVLRHDIEAIVLFGENIKKTANIANRQLICQKKTFIKPNRNYFSKKIIFASICILLIIFFSTVIGDFSLYKSVVKADSVHGVGVGIYWDQNCTNKTNSVNWGLTDIGSSYNLTVYVRNECNSAVSLGLCTSNWAPSASSGCISLGWNYTGHILKTAEVIPLELKLSVSPTIVDIFKFSFITTISAIGQ